MVINDRIKDISKLIKKSKTIFIMSHKNLDLDALGSCIGIYELLKKLGKKCYIIIDDKVHEMGVAKVLKEIQGTYEIINSNETPIYLHKNSKKNLLIILDTNKKDLIQNNDILEYFSRKMIIDHHELGKTSIKDAYLVLDISTSSTCEMITQLIQEYEVELTPYIYTIILSGIVLDTNNFTLKTSAETYYSAYFLTASGASPKKVQYLLKQDIKDYAEQQKLLANMETINKNIAIAKGTPYIVYRREDLARIADTLLFFNDIEISFVIGKVGKNKVGVSARSLGNYNISSIMTSLGGGGDSYNGAAVFENMHISEVLEKVKMEIKKQEGE